MQSSWIAIITATLLAGATAHAEEKKREQETPVSESSSRSLDMAFGAGLIASPRPYVGATP